MLRYVRPQLLPRPVSISPSYQATTRCLATKRPSHTGTSDEDEIAAARAWLAALSADTIRQRAPSETTFSRSSGPGGQNVNKVSSKATLRLPTASLLPLLPTLFHGPLLQSRYHAAASNALVIQADDSRKQADNVNACFRKLHDLIVAIGRDVVPGETSAAQVQRVKGLEKADKARTRVMKDMRSKKKAGRKGGGSSSDGY